MQYLQIFLLDLKYAAIKFLRFGGEGAEGKRYFSYIFRRNKNLPQHSQRQQENQKEALKYSLQNENKATQNQDDTKHKRTLFAASSQNKLQRVYRKENDSRLGNNRGLW